MTTQEFSNQFDTLISAYLTRLEFGITDVMAFDEYEKSVFLTDAQEEIVIELYSGKNSFGDSFEKTEETRRIINELIKTYTTEEKINNQLGISKDSVFFEIPKDVWFITYESVTLNDEGLGCLSGEEVIVSPITQDDFDKVKDNPFRGPSKKRVLRLDNENSIIEIVSKYNIDRYLIRYLAQPNPIILIDLPDSLSINGVSIKTECELNPVIHRIILERAVRKAIASRIPAGK